MVHRIAWLFVLIALAFPAVSAAQERAGTVSRAKGDVTAVFGGATRDLAAGSSVFVGDRILTGEAARVEITMIDDAVVTLGDDSEFTIGEFEEAERGRLFGLFRGVFLATSGTVADGRTSPMTIRAPLALIGVRGTTVWGVQTPERLQVVLLDGRVFVESLGRRVDLTEPLTSTTVLPGAAPTAPVRISEEALDAARATVSFE